MKKRFLTLAVYALVSVALPLSLASCGDDDDEPKKNVSTDNRSDAGDDNPVSNDGVQSISLKNTTLQMTTTSEAQTIAYSIQPRNAENKEVKVSSSSNSVCTATVDKSQTLEEPWDAVIAITPKGVGTATVTIASAENPAITATIQVKVEEPYDPTKEAKPNAWAISGIAKGNDGKYYLRQSYYTHWGEQKEYFEYSGQWLTKWFNYDLKNGEVKVTKNGGVTNTFNYYTDSNGRVTKVIVRNYVGDKFTIPSSLSYDSSIHEAEYNMTYNSNGTINMIKYKRQYYRSYVADYPTGTERMLIDDDCTVRYTWSNGDISKIAHTGTRHMTYYGRNDDYLGGAYANDEVNWTNTYFYTDELNTGDQPLYSFFIPTFWGSPVSDNLAVFGLYGPGTKHVCNGFTNTNDIDGTKKNISVATGYWPYSGLLYYAHVNDNFEKRFGEFNAPHYGYHYTEYTR